MEALKKIIRGKIPFYIVGIPSTEYNRIIDSSDNFMNSCEVIGLYSKMKQEFEKLVVGWGIEKWNNYLTESQYDEFLFKTPKQSFMSLIMSERMFLKEWIDKFPELIEPEKIDNYKFTDFLILTDEL